MNLTPLRGHVVWPWPCRRSFVGYFIAQKMYICMEVGDDEEICKDRNIEDTIEGMVRDLIETKSRKNCLRSPNLTHSLIIVYLFHSST